ncbi:MAG: type I methionyl aminopeptidase [Clostridia bacterium]|nr:type I methionyl aminopeptidase [Clostridia bacterium]
MINIKSKSEIELMKIAGRVTGEALKRVEEAVKVGVTTAELNDIAEKYIRSQGCTPSFKNYGGFPGSVCASVNDVIIHGFPSNIPLLEGDVVSIDVGACYKGYHGDAARTFGVGKISSEAQRLIDVTKESFFKGAEFAKEGFRISDISGAIQKYVEENGFSILRDYCGHGIGSHLHEEPDIPNYITKSRGPRMRAGMVIAVEPMVNQGEKEYYVADDEWAVLTADGKLSAHYENTILITDGEPVFLTLVD